MNFLTYQISDFIDVMQAADKEDDLAFIAAQFAGNNFKKSEAATDILYGFDGK